MEPITITLPDWMFGWKGWAILIVSINAIYGYITHLHSLPAVRRWNETNKVKETIPRTICADHLLQIFLLRILFGLPLRVASFIIGLIVEILMFVVTGGSFVYNPILQNGWRWHMAPNEFYEYITSASCDF